MLIAFSPIPDFQVRLPAGDDQLYLIINIRDTFDCVTEFNMSFVSVVADSLSMNDLSDILQNITDEINKNSLIRLLASKSQNIVGQILISLSKEFNKINNQIVENAVLSKYSITILTMIKTSFFRWCCSDKYFHITIGKSNFPESIIIHI
jgi:hypothetical protein